MGSKVGGLATGHGTQGSARVKGKGKEVQAYGWQRSIYTGIAIGICSVCTCSKHLIQ